ncbi:EamA family transporter [Embleya scabrispora]|uniref:EamA family transporter n=1 Tax=Embleya scabrispora TaxID=159449 RepID=UPI000374D36D|nr:DMT family transporter [Embleya scabrispora]MYS83661.1 EamA family transporter [Streptomyces sp. SID5474]
MTSRTTPDATSRALPAFVDRLLPGAQGRSVLLVLASACSIQFGAAFAARLFPYVGPAGAVTLRLVLAASILLAFARPRLRGRTRADWVVVVGLGVMFAGMNMFFYEAIDRLPLGPAVTLEFLGPLGLAVVLSRRLRDMTWIVLAAVGVLLLGRGGFSGLDPVGIAFVMAAAACWAGYIVVASKISKRFDGVEGLALGFAVAAVLVTPLGVATAGSSLLEPEVLGLGACVALLSSALPYSFEMLAMKHLTPATFGLLASLEPAVAAIAGFLVLHQSLVPIQIAGIALVVIASAGVTVAQSPRRVRVKSDTAGPEPDPPPVPGADAIPTPAAIPDACAESPPRTLT